MPILAYHRHVRRFKTARPQEVEVVVADVVVRHVAVAPIAPAGPPAVADNEDLTGLPEQAK